MSHIPLTRVALRLILLIACSFNLTLPCPMEAQQNVSHNSGTAVSSPVHFLIQNAYTEFGVSDATISVQLLNGAPPTGLQPLGKTSTAGRMDGDWPYGDYAIEVSATGYKVVRLVIHLNAANTVKQWVVNLYPPSKPQELINAESQVRAGYGVVAGYVMDATSHKPLSGAALHILPADFHTTTNSDGFFSMTIPATNDPDDDRSSDIETVQVTLTGYKTYLIANIEVVGNDYSPVNVRLAPGTGTENHRRASPLA